VVRSVVALTLSVILSAPATAASERHSRARQPAAARPTAEVNKPSRFAVPGWSDEQTRQWLDNASSSTYVGG
jgi:hypothetical protein